MDPDSPAREAPAGAFLATRVVVWLIRICGALSALLILTILAIVTYAVVKRYVFDTPLLWGDELNGYLLVAAVMLGAAEALRRGDHISIDLLTARLDRRYAPLASVWASLAVLVFAVVLGWSAWKSIGFARDFGSYSPGYLEVGMWIPMYPVLIGAVLLGLVAVVRILEAAGGRARP